jgi:formylglycine-generating enzyme required for sulfatase activity/uncharacterized caspase-like protein
MNRISMLCAVTILLAGLPASARADEGRNWAILIGVNEYLDPKIPQLQYCVEDARKLFETLTRLGDFQPDRVLLLVDDQPKAHLRPLRLNLQSQIEGWLANCQPQDTVIIAFSGHGFVDELTGEGFLAPADCELDDLRGTGFATERLRQMLRKCRARKKLLILDCCFAGAERSGVPTGATGQELSEAFREAQGLITLASSRKDERSQEWPEKGQGLFTYFLLEGLAGKADYDGDGVVNVDELYRYTFENVPLAAQRELNARQRPVRIIGPDTEGVFALSRVAVVPRPLDTSVIAQFTVRETDRDGPLVPGATVELFHRLEGEARPALLASGRTDTSGRSQLEVTMSLFQQSQGTFAVAVRRGDTSRSYSLERFPQSRSYALYLPRATAPTTPPPATPIPPRATAATSPPTAPPIPASPRPGTTIENSIGMKLAWIPAGQFLMGSPETDNSAFSDDKPQHLVRITKPFHLGVMEVTQVQYEQVMGTNPSHFQGGSLPVESVTWDEAVEFCRRLSSLPEERAAGRVYRLPTEAEWEYAARAGSTGKWCFGDDESELGDYAWYGMNSESRTHPVGQKRPNAWGLYDMHGNVWEWCEDVGKRVYVAREVRDGDLVEPIPVDDPSGTGVGSNRVGRGGSWYGTPGQHCRSAHRLGLGAQIGRGHSVGFRVAFSSVDQSRSE